MKIGFIAMSGVRAWDTELLAFGLSMPGFVERKEVIAQLPSLGLLTLAALTPDCDEISYHEIFDFEKDTPPAGPFDLVAISSFTAQIEEAYQLADHYRQAGVRVIMGGLHVSCMPNEAILHADAIVVGEAEEVWPQVIEDARSGTLKPIYRPSRPWNLGDSPIPRFDLLNPAKYNRITVQTSRGCPWKCDFCASSILIAPRYQTKPVAKVVEEIRRIKSIWPRPFIADFRRPLIDDKFIGVMKTGIPVDDSPPRDFGVIFCEIRLPQNWVVRATIKVHDDAAPRFNFDSAGRLNKLAIDGLGLAQIEAVKLMCQPAIAAVRNHCQYGVKIHVQTHFARQTVLMKEVHAAPERIFNSVSSRVVCHKIPSRDLIIVGQEECRMFATQSGHRDLSNLSFVTGQFDTFIDVANLLMPTLRNIDYSIMPCARWQALKPF